MLVLSRKRNESIVIKHSIVVTVLRIRGDHVTIGIEAPAEMPVHRNEVYGRIRRPEVARNVAAHPNELRCAIVKTWSDTNQRIEGKLSGG
jgi:carbon storage regulator